MMNVNVGCLLFKGLEGVLLQFTPSFSAQQQNSNDDVRSSFCLVLFTMGWNFHNYSGAGVDLILRRKTVAEIFFFSFEANALFWWPAHWPGPQPTAVWQCCCPPARLSSFQKQHQSVTLHSAQVCDTVWVGRGVQLEPAQPPYVKLVI